MKSKLIDITLRRIEKNSCYIEPYMLGYIHVSYDNFCSLFGEPDIDRDDNNVVEWTMLLADKWIVHAWSHSIPPENIPDGFALWWEGKETAEALREYFISNKITGFIVIPSSDN